MKHRIDPCNCGRRFLDGETCVICGRHTLGALLEGAMSWYPLEFDPVLRSFRGLEAT